ncbi:uncharacterized protein [Miscanthus floridulus]|uniref:uncharacterized protein isoform X2 n=1 Tax=Miscanthus floridulus TaxID=154761 RepID=UPI00345B3734
MTLAALICDTGQRKALKVNRHLSEGAAAGLLAGRCKPTTAYETIKKLLKLAEVCCRQSRSSQGVPGTSQRQYSQGVAESSLR